MFKITLEDFKIPNTCGECKHIGHYKYGAYARNPHCCCELIWQLKGEDCKVDEDSLDEDCPLISINKNWKQTDKYDALDDRPIGGFHDY